MSKTIGHGTGHKYNGVRHPCHDYWSRRPGNKWGCPTGKDWKKITHGKERAQKKQLIYNVVKDYNKDAA